MCRWRLLNYVVAIYLIVVGVLGLAHHFNLWAPAGMGVADIHAFLATMTWNRPS